MQRQLVALACSGLLLTLAACGGGGEPIGGSNTVFVKPVSVDAITQTLTVVTSSEQPVFTMGLPTDTQASASSQTLSDGTNLVLTSLTGTYTPVSGDAQTVQLQVTYSQDNADLYIIGLSIGDNGAKHTCLGGNWSETQLADVGADGTTSPACDGTITIDTKKATIVAKDITALTDADASVKVNFAVTLPQPQP
jgi:hypothetical protein